MADRDTVRLLAGASVTDASDTDIDALLLEEQGVVKLAAALLLELMAGRLQAVTSDDITVDGSKQAGVLTARAAALRAQYYEHGGDFYFGAAPVAPDYRRWWPDDDVVTDYSGPTVHEGW